MENFVVDSIRPFRCMNVHASIQIHAQASATFVNCLLQLHLIPEPRLEC